MSNQLCGNFWISNRSSDNFSTLLYFELNSVLWKCFWTFLTLNPGLKKLYGYLAHLAHCEFYHFKLIMSSHPSGITPNHGLRVRHRRIHTAGNSRNWMSNRLCHQFLNIKPFFWQFVHFTPFWTKSSFRVEKSFRRFLLLCFRPVAFCGFLKSWSSYHNLKIDCSIIQPY